MPLSIESFGALFLQLYPQTRSTLGLLKQVQIPKVRERVPFPPLHAFEQSSTLTQRPDADLV